MEQGPRFGEVPEGTSARRRHSAYGVALRGGRVLLVEAPYGWFLPGGGVHPGEQPEVALAREVLEETGYRVEAWEPAARAEQVTWIASDDEFVVKDCLFFRCELSATTTGGDEDDHTPAWVWIDAAPEILNEAASAWAVATLLGG